MFKPDSYLVRIFSLIRFFQVPHTIQEAMIRFQISRRSMYRYFEELELAGISIKDTHRCGFDDGSHLYQLVNMDLPTL